MGSRGAHHPDGLATALEQITARDGFDGLAAALPAAARQLVRSDGATFVLRDGSACRYVSEDAVSPLWAGERFPMSVCISGWVMLRGEPAISDNIYLDERIPHEAYRPTFVSSLAMVPIGAGDPVGAIGAYWAATHGPSERDVALLTELAEVAASALAPLLASAGDAAAV